MATKEVISRCVWCSRIYVDYVWDTGLELSLCMACIKDREEHLESLNADQLDKFLSKNDLGGQHSEG